jgi:hypothetical protein
MSISNQTDKIFGTGDGTTTVFSFPFKIFAPTDLVIYEIDTTQTPNVSHTKTYLTDYSVSINTVGEGGTVTFVVAPPLSWQTLIQRVEPFTQSLVLNTEGNLPAQQIGNQLDLMTMLCIQVNEAVSRCPQLPVTYSGSLPLIMPLPQAGLVLAWDPTASFLVNVVATTQGNIALPISNGNITALTAANKVNGSSLYGLGNTPSGAGALPKANIDPTVANYTLPSGAIIMWSGSIASIPSGFVLCNGSNGTPDLRNQFIVGADADVAGVAKSTITGAALQTSNGQLPALSVGIPGGQPSGGNAAFTYNPASSPGVSNGSAATQTYGVTGAPATGGSVIVAKFYALAFIMKT